MNRATAGAIIKPQRPKVTAHIARLAQAEYTTAQRSSQPWLSVSHSTAQASTPTTSTGAWPGVAMARRRQTLSLRQGTRSLRLATLARSKANKPNLLILSRRQLLANRGQSTSLLQMEFVDGLLTPKQTHRRAIAYFYV